MAKAAVADGVARMKHADIKQAVRNAMWEPVYRPIKAAKRNSYRINQIVKMFRYRSHSGGK
ncbi:hypothetical protein GCM10020331_095530 [Ectobacillus funiculus]